jgi:cysteine sulfinate desulfinase/cysteine desulfurase-like protein
LFPVKEIADLCRSRGVLYHCDAVQAVGKVEVDVRNVPADYLSVTGHKFHAPKVLAHSNTTNITFGGIEAEALLILLDQEGICASSGSACLADSSEPSHVVKAMKPNSAASGQMIRFSLDSANTMVEIKHAAAVLGRAAIMLRG